LGGTVKVDWPILVNLRLDPFERTGLSGSLNFYHWFVYEFWRFVFVKQEVAKYAQTFLEYPPMQKGAEGRGSSRSRRSPGNATRTSELPAPPDRERHCGASGATRGAIGE
jgi:hypothetical protein